MKLVYLIVVGLIVTIVVTDVMIHIAKLENNMAAFIGLLVGMLVIAYNFIKGSFEQTIFKEFIYSVLIGIAVLVISTSIFVLTGLDQLISPYLVALLAGVYSFKRIANYKHQITDKKEIDNFFKKRKCPCCQEEISKKYFLKQILFKQGSFSFTENEKGIVCLKCNKPILSAEKKHWIPLFPMNISMIPIIVFGLVSDISFSKEYTFKFVLIFSFSFVLFVLLLLKKYNDIDFICDDQSSDEFNYHSIHK